MTPRSSRYARAFAAACLLLLGGVTSTSCGDEQEPRITVAEPASPSQDWQIDLLADLENARLRVERSKVDIERNRVMVELEGGWIAHTPLTKRHSGLFGTGDRSTLELFLAAPRSLVLKLVCEAKSVPPEGRRQVRVKVGGELVGQIRLGLLRPEERTVSVPQSALRRGTNLIEFEYLGEVQRESELPAREQDPVRMMGCAEIAFGELADGERPTPLPAGGIRLPARSAVDFFVDVPDDLLLQLL
jgi:hypothetical protein